MKTCRLPVVLSLVFLVFLSSCESPPEPLSPEETAAYEDLLTDWVDIFNNDRFHDYGTHQSATCDFFGEVISNEANPARNAWFDARPSRNRVDYKYDPASIRMDSVGYETVQALITLNATHDYEKGVTESTVVRVHLTRGEVLEIIKVEGDLQELADRVIADGKEIAKAEGFYSPNGELNWQLMEVITEDVTGDFDDFAFATRAEGKDLLYVVNGAYEPVTWEFDKWEKKGKMGLADFEGNLLLAPKYDLVYSFGTLIEGLAEVELDGKFGLVDTNGELFLPPRYDRILPPVRSGDKALVQLGERYGAVKREGKIEWDQPVPAASEILKAYDFKEKLNGDDKYKGSELLPLSKEKGMGYASYVFPPAAFQQMGFAPAILPVKLYDPGTTQALQIEQELSLGEKIQGFIAMLETWTFEPRYSYHDQAYSLHTYDPELNSLTNQQLVTTGGDETVGHYCEGSEIRLVGKDTLEVKYVMSNRPKSKYEEETVYTYFVIREDGTAEELTSDRTFPFTEFVRINEDYLKTCRCEAIPEHLWDPDKSKEVDQFYGEYWVYYHYFAKEVETMIREIEESYSEGEDRPPIDQANLEFLQNYLPGLRSHESARVGKAYKYEAW